MMWRCIETDRRNFTSIFSMRSSSTPIEQKAMKMFVAERVVSVIQAKQSMLSLSLSRSILFRHHSCRSSVNHWCKMISYSRQQNTLFSKILHLVDVSMIIDLISNSFHFLPFAATDTHTISSFMPTYAINTDGSSVSLDSFLSLAHSQL